MDSTKDSFASVSLNKLLYSVKYKKKHTFFVIYLFLSETSRSSNKENKR